VLTPRRGALDGTRHTFLGRMVTRVAASPVALALVAGWTLGGCSMNPATGQNQLMLISEAQEIEMGREYDPQVVASIGLYPDDTWQRYIQQLGSQIAATGERPNLPWTFRVVDDPAVNAFAVPGGFIYVTRGLLAHVSSEAELVSVLGHEIGHVTARHTVSQMSQQQLAGLGLALGSIVSSEFERHAGLANTALGLLFLKYSRDDESEADDLGLRYMRRANFDPRAMPEVFTLLERVSATQGGGRLPEWLTTHPNPANRRDNIAAQIAAMPQDFSGTTVNRDAYLRRLDDQVFGMNPREGYFKGSHFVHPDMRFQIDFPAGWTTDNGKQAVVAVSGEKDAVIELTLVEGSNAESAARAFLGQQGITSGSPSNASSHGLPTAGAQFAATTEGGALGGYALFVEHGRAVFRLLGYAPEARWSSRRAVIERALLSFQPLTDRAALDVQPHRLDIIQLERRTTIEALEKERPSPVSGAELALINHVEVTTPLEPRRLIKWVVGRPLP
jgi:predicted Zn-dependent protease